MVRSRQRSRTRATPITNPLPVRVNVAPTGDWLVVVMVIDRRWRGWAIRLHKVSAHFKAVVVISP